MTALATSQQIRALQTARRAAGISDDAWHDRLSARHSVTSTKLLTAEQADAELIEINGGSSRAFKKSDKPYVRKVYALWTDAGRRGAIKDRSKNALRAFIGRQLQASAGEDPAKVARDPEFLTPAEANKVSEGLKAMINRTKGA